MQIARMSVKPMKPKMHRRYDSLEIVGIAGIAGLVHATAGKDQHQRFSGDQPA